MSTRSTLVSRWLERADDTRVAIVGPQGTDGWRGLVEASARFAAGLLDGRRSLEGERVALLVAPGSSFVVAFFGVLRAGGCVVVLSPLHPPRETTFFCDDAGVRTVVASDPASLAFLAPERRVLRVDDVSGTGAVTALPLDDDPALQLYTSGTTGKPKGAVLTHANLAVQQGLLREAWGWRSDDTLLHVLPLHHMHGLAIALLSAIGSGAATKMLPGFAAAGAWGAMADATVFMAVPTVYAKLFEAFDAADPTTRASWTASARRLRLATSGSAALPVTLGERWRALTGAYPLERFGMTEIGVGTTNPLAPEGRRPGTVGKPLPTVGTRVVDDELWIAGPSVFAGYHLRPQADAEAFATDDAGVRWFKTGDTVSVDADGYVRILGRTSVDILKSGGYKLSALEIEEALREHPAVAEVAVVGLPDATWGDRVVACVVARADRDAECDEATLRAFVRERLAPYKVPKQVVLMAELPRNAVGKVVKPTLVRSLKSEA